jgi:hypothetical protein
MVVRVIVSRRNTLDVDQSESDDAPAGPSEVIDDTAEPSDRAPREPPALKSVGGDPEPPRTGATENHSIGLESCSETE